MTFINKISRKHESIVWFLGHDKNLKGLAFSYVLCLEVLTL